MRIKSLLTVLLVLCLCLGGCGKKTAPKSQAKAKPSSASVGQEANNTQPKVESKKPEPPKVAPHVLVARVRGRRAQKLGGEVLVHVW